MLSTGSKPPCFPYLSKLFWFVLLCTVTVLWYLLITFPFHRVSLLLSISCSLSLLHGLYSITVVDFCMFFKAFLNFSFSLKTLYSVFFFLYPYTLFMFSIRMIFIYDKFSFPHSLSMVNILNFSFWNSFESSFEVLFKIYSPIYSCGSSLIEVSRFSFINSLIFFWKPSLFDVASSWSPDPWTFLIL